MKAITEDSNPALSEEACQEECRAGLTYALGVAFQALGSMPRGDVEYLRRAIDAHKEALKIHERNGTATEQAVMLHSLGDSFLALGDRTGDAGYIRQAIAAYERALGLTDMNERPDLADTVNYDLRAAQDMLRKIA